MNIRLRTPTDADWPAILEAAHAALPWDADGNREWLENRKKFADRRRHYVVEDTHNNTVIGYGAVEEGPEPGLFRMYVVISPDNLRSGIGDQVYDQLRADLTTLEARGIWVREYARDLSTLNFFSAKGFEEKSRFTLPDAVEEMVVLIHPLA